MFSMQQTKLQILFIHLYMFICIKSLALVTNTYFTLTNFSTFPSTDIGEMVFNPS